MGENPPNSPLRHTFTRGEFLKVGGVAALYAALPVAGIAGTAARASAAPLFSESTLWVENEDGYALYHVFGLTRANDGTVLVFAEARIEPDDAGRHDLVLKRSEDNGATWKATQRIQASTGRQSWAQPAPVVDVTTGKIFFFYALNEGNRSSRVFYKSSSDNGVSWSSRQEVTSLFDDDPYGWTLHMPGPGHGIQLANGRLLLQIWHRKSISFPVEERNYGISVIYSDDGGQSWRAGGVVPVTSAQPINESRLVQLENGDVLLNARLAVKSQERAISRSRDGGASWSEPVTETNLPPFYATDSGLARLTPGADSDVSRIVFSSPTDDDSRRNMFVRISYDECESWRYGKTLYTGAASYSDLTSLSDGSILLLYGKDESQYSPNTPRSVVAARFNLEWLTDRRDSLADGPTGVYRFYQAEGMRSSTNVPRSAMFTDGAADGGAVVVCKADSAGDYYEVNVNVGSTDVYRVLTRWRTAQNRARVRLTIDGVGQGEVFDPYSARVGYREFDLDTVGLERGIRRFRFTAVGKNSRSTGYGMLPDSIRLRFV